MIWFIFWVTYFAEEHIKYFNFNPHFLYKQPYQVWWYVSLEEGLQGVSGRVFHKAHAMGS